MTRDRNSNACYLDHNATTPLDPEVQAEMDSCLVGAFGNPSSLHSFGRQARQIVDKARLRVSRLIGARPEEIIFTSGGTEADNMAILGSVAVTERTPRHVVTTAIEHQAVLNTCRHLEQMGCEVTYLTVDSHGLLEPARLAAALRAETALVSIMLANNDIGTIQPVAAISALTKERGIVLHTDAVQGVGKIPVDVKALGVDLLSFSAHKLHGPRGAGALFVRKGIRLSPVVFGGHQEAGLRPGTENVAAIAGFGKACELAAARLEEDAARLTALRDSFEKAIRARLPGVTVNGLGAPRLANTSNLGFEGLEGEMLALNLDLLGVAVSTGSACSSGDHQPSHVLLAMGRSAAEARSAIRVSFGRDNTAEETGRAIDRVCQAVESMRGGRR